MTTKSNHDIQELDLSAIEPVTHDSAIRFFRRGNMEAFTSCGYSWGATLRVVLDNRAILNRRKLYERALVYGFIGCKRNHSDSRIAVLERLFMVADRGRLRAAGQRLTSPGPFRVYRGVAGKGRARKVRGLSWTGSRDIACYFAAAGAGALDDPAVYETTVTADEVYCYTNARGEDEFIVRPKKCKRLKISAEALQAAGQRIAEQRRRGALAKLNTLKQKFKAKRELAAGGGQA